jgi:hypothetical protein
MPTVNNSVPKPRLHYFHRALTLDICPITQEAVQLIQQVVVEVKKIDKQVAIIIAFLRMDEACPAASRIEHNKVYTAARDRKDTKLMGEFMLNNNRPPDFWGDEGITGLSHQTKKQSNRGNWCKWTIGRRR